MTDADRGADEARKKLADQASAWWSTWVVGKPDRWVSLSLLVALILLSREPPRHEEVALHLIVLAVLLGLSLRWRIAPVALIALLVIGIDLRLVYEDTTASDVDDVTRAAIGRVMAGENPYGAGYEVSNPPGAPFPYGPLLLLWYVPWHDPSTFDLAVSMVILAALALRGHILGTALYATAPVLLSIASDGSNDTSAGLLILVALVAARHRPVAGALLLGLAIAFKPYALAWAPGLIALAGLPAAVAVVAGAAAFWLPAAIAWSPGAILHSLSMSQQVNVPPWYSLGQVLERFGAPLSRDQLETLGYLAGGATAVAVMATVRTWSGVIIGGILIFLATLYLGYWSTFAYVSAIAPVVCWYIDEWLDRADRRVAWPMDPVGRLTGAVGPR